MEPMTIGSPNTSLNASAHFDATSPSNSQFLPSFLLGCEHGNDSLIYSSPKLTSPTKSQLNSFQSSMSYNLMAMEKNTLQTSISNAEKHDGPPIISLADYSISHPLSPTNLTNDISINHATRDFQIPEDFSENWVTIFGFTPSQLDLVLSYFIRYGQIVEKKYSSNGGNWIHIRYSNRREAQTALSQNGKQISSNLMIGVVSRKDKHHLDNVTNRSLNFHSQTEIPQRPILGASVPPTIRRLTVNNSENEVVSLTNLPTKSSGVVSKTMEYLFGW